MLRVFKPSAAPGWPVTRPSTRPSEMSQVATTLHHRFHVLLLWWIQNVDDLSPQILCIASTNLVCFASVSSEARRLSRRDWWDNFKENVKEFGQDVKEGFENFGEKVEDAWKDATDCKKLGEVCWGKPRCCGELQCERRRNSAVRRHQEHDASEEVQMFRKQK